VPLRIDDPSTPLALLYVDDLIDQWLEIVDDPPKTSGFAEPRHMHRTTVGEVAQLIEGYAEERARGEIRDIETGLARVLYSSFVAALPIADANYPLPSHNDARGSFVEILKIAGSGQFAYFSAHPGVTRGGHYHHSKVEKFLVAHGTGRFRFRQILSGENFELVSSASEPLMIETIPGWAHDVTNIGDDELVVLTWASERFDPDRPDTYSMPL
jgi:UDP-2-acetamido-2,6-beta-L-arabino-hexul-4-ose reductase